MSNNIVLYHGSYVAVEKPDLRFCGKGKDFGEGFYLTSDENQAKRFLATALGKAKKNGRISESINTGFVSRYEFVNSGVLNVYEFETASREWLHCVAAHRREGLLENELEKWVPYDVIIGKIANDNTNRVITAYIQGVYGTPGSESADDIVIRLLLPEKLTDQFCFRSEKAMQCLRFLGSEELEVDWK